MTELLGDAHRLNYFKRYIGKSQELEDSTTFSVGQLQPYVTNGIDSSGNATKGKLQSIDA